MNRVERFADIRRHSKEARLIPEPNRESSGWWKWPRIRWNHRASSQFIQTALCFCERLFHDELHWVPLTTSSVTTSTLL